MKNLKFLDCYEVTVQERNTIEAQQFFHNAVVIKDSDSGRYSNEDDDTNEVYTPLPNTESGKEEESESKGRIKFRLKVQLENLMFLIKYH